MRKYAWFAFLFSVVVGCVSSRAPERHIMTVPVLHVRNAAPAGGDEISPQQAKVMLGVTGRVTVIATGDTSHEISVGFIDERGKCIFLTVKRLEMWGSGPDRYFINSYWAYRALLREYGIEPSADHPSVGQSDEGLAISEEEVSLADPRFKAFAVLCLDWVRSKYTEREIQMIREELQNIRYNNVYYIAQAFGLGKPHDNGTAGEARDGSDLSVDPRPPAKSGDRGFGASF